MRTLCVFYYPSLLYTMFTIYVYHVYVDIICIYISPNKMKIGLLHVKDQQQMQEEEVIATSIVNPVGDIDILKGKCEQQH